ncbi:winged helix DNA-binding domain-containing protein [Isoptericola sp. NPDC057653]|uniref:winged helix DNA-binding domain-containing protein n=1 Tax=unclassified Isoptericola TaxID=2623355 RepID=UPI0036CB9B3D
MRITGEQRRRRLVVRQLALGVEGPGGGPAARSPEDVTRRLVALHATDAPSVHLAVLARTRGVTLDDVRDALFVRRSLVKVLGMRRTMFVVPRETVPVVHAAASAAVGRRLRARLLKELATLPTDPLVEDPEALLAAAEAQVHAALAAGPLDGAELSRAAPLLRTAFLPTSDKAWDVRRTMTSPLLSLLSAEGAVVRGEPRGAWSSPRHVWSPMSDWFPDGIPDLDEDAARVELARAWLEAFGPATVADLRWWTGWNLGQARRAVAALDTRDVEVEVGAPGAGAVAEGVVLRSTDLDADLDPALDDVVAGHAALLPTLDPTTMGWTARDWYLGPHRGHLFDSAGNAGATVWWQGRVVGLWVVRPDGEVAWRLLEDVGADGRAAVAAEAERLGALLAGSTFTPGYTTPAYRELLAG